MELQERRQACQREDECFMDFGDRLKQLRLESGLTLDDLKEVLDTTKATLSRYENKQRDPKSEFVKKCADYFKVSVDYMMGESGHGENIEKDSIEDVLQDSLDKIRNIEKMSIHNKRSIAHIINLIEVAICVAKMERFHGESNNKEQSECTLDMTRGD